MPDSITLQHLSGPSGWPVWCFATCVCMTFYLLDIFIVHRYLSVITFIQACWLCIFWVIVACVFSMIIGMMYQPSYGYLFFNGVLMEYTLSVDNLFVFYIVLKQFYVPENQKYRALSWGLLGAVIIRLFFFLSFNTPVLQSMNLLTIFLGFCILIKELYVVFEQSSPTLPEDFFLIKLLMKTHCLWPYYNSIGQMFIFPQSMSKIIHQELPVRNDNLNRVEACITTYHTPLPALVTPASLQYHNKATSILDSEEIHQSQLSQNLASSTSTQATLLCVVIVLVEVMDSAFSIDSTSAKKELIPNVFISYFSTVTATFGLRGIYFLTEYFIASFHLMKYGLIFILINIQTKIIFDQFLVFPCYIFLQVVMIILIISIMTSLLFETVLDDYGTVPFIRLNDVGS